MTQAGVATSEYDALADLFLGPTRGAGVTPVGMPKPGVSVEPLHKASGTLVPHVARIEALVLGHLPVLASAWAMQYARDCAERLGGWVGVLKARAGQVAVELVGAAHQAPGVTAAASLEDAVRAASGLVRLWLLRAEAPSEPSVLELPGVDGVTILCGADEAAIVASYQTLKNLHEGGVTKPLGAVGVAVMGSPPDKAGEAAQRLSRAAETFLGHGLPMTACVPRISAGRVVTLFRGPSAGAPEAVLRDLIERVRSAPQASATPPPAMVREPVSDMSPNHTAAIAPKPSTPSAERPSMLTGLLPGLLPMRARCPFEPGVELAADGQGRLHLLAEGGVREATASLAAAGGWAGEHLSVLRLTPGGEGLGGALPVKHLMTREPKAARRALDTDLRVHGLACAGGAWVALDLN